MQLVYQIIASYFEDNCADELTNDPVMTAILDKEALASQPTLSRFWNRMDGDTLSQLDMIFCGQAFKSQMLQKSLTTIVCRKGKALTTTTRVMDTIHCSVMMD